MVNSCNANPRGQVPLQRVDAVLRTGMCEDCVHSNVYSVTYSTYSISLNSIYKVLNLYYRMSVNTDYSDIFTQQKTRAVQFFKFLKCTILSTPLQFSVPELFNKLPFKIKQSTFLRRFRFKGRRLILYFSKMHNN